jgi:CheY-like chemotaxis protein
VLEWIRSNDVEIPVVVLTAYLIDDDKQSLMSLGALDVVSKPVENAKLKGIIERYRRLRSRESTKSDDCHVCEGPGPTHTS